MIIHNNTKYIQSPFSSEEEIKNVVLENYEFLFGPSTIMLAKKKINLSGGDGTIPDGFAINIDRRCWYVVEVELIKHSVWGHIAPQMAKQFISLLSN